ncbi:hypothetical protein ACQKWADRAFT_5227 [Trichoderma austrokoningii]
MYVPRARTLHISWRQGRARIEINPAHAPVPTTKSCASYRIVHYRPTSTPPTSLPRDRRISVAPVTALAASFQARSVASKGGRVYRILSCLPLFHGFQPSLQLLPIVIFTPPGAKGARFDLESLARTQKQVQSSTADLPGSWSPPALILLVPNLLSWGRPRASLGHPPSQKVVVGPLPLAAASRCTERAPFWLSLRNTHHTISRRHHMVALDLSAWVPRSSERWETAGPNGSLLASSFIALCSLPSFYPLSLPVFNPKSAPRLSLLVDTVPYGIYLAYTYASPLRSSSAPFPSRQASGHSTADAELDPALLVPLAFVLSQMYRRP